MDKCIRSFASWARATLPLSMYRKTSSISPPMKTLLLLTLLISLAYPQFHLSIENLSDSALSKEQITPSINHPNPIEICHFSNYKKTMYAYAVLRDQFGIFTRFADSAQWVSSDTTKITVTSTPNKQFECILNRKREFVEGTISLIVYENNGNTSPDTMFITMIHDGSSIRLLDSDKKIPLDTITCLAGDSINLQIQSSPPMLPWINDSAYWSFSAVGIMIGYLVPTKRASSWVFKPTTSGNGRLIISLGGYMDKTVPIIVTPKTSSVKNIQTNHASPTMLTKDTKTNSTQIAKIVALNGQILYKNNGKNSHMKPNLRNGIYIIETIHGNCTSVTIGRDVQPDVSTPESKKP